MAGKQKNTSHSGRKPSKGDQRHAAAPQQRPYSTRQDSHRQGRGDSNRNEAPSKPAPLRSTDGYFLFGRNSIEAALQNSRRECVQLIGTEKALEALNLPTNRAGVRQHIADPAMLDASVPIGAPHQGLILEVRPLAGIVLDQLGPIEGQKNIILMLDQVTDPQNVGACLRSAAAFGARALITQDKNSPKETASLARASAGTIELIPWLSVTNLSKALDQLKDMGYWHVGLDGNTETSIRDVSMGENIVIVMGSEGSGLRPLVRKNCDAVASIPMSDAVESLNVSAAAAIALYELSN